MSRSWNGSSLVNELSALLGDTSTAFKSRVLGWLNDTIMDISTRYDWGHHLTKGKKILAYDSESHSLEIAAPTAPDVELDDDGELESGSVYTVLVTYVQANGVETVAGAESEELTATDSQKTINLSNIPTSDESLVTKRYVYLKKDDGAFYFHSEIDDNFTTSLVIDSDTDSTIEPPDYESIRKLYGSPYFEDESIYLNYKSMDQLRKVAQGTWTSGQPEYFSVTKANEITTYPIPSSLMELSFNYYRNPFQLYNETGSIPDLPVALKPVIKAGVIALGYEYRDRQGQEGKKAFYEQLIVDSINRVGEVSEIEYVVRDVYGNPDGFEV